VRAVVASILRASCSRSTARGLPQELMTPSGGKAWRDELRRIGHNMSADFHRWVTALRVVHVVVAHGWSTYLPRYLGRRYNAKPKWARHVCACKH
jgi:hypothetical protein